MTSRIEAGITVEGSIRGEGEIEVAGRLRGALTLDGTLTVEEGGVVEADVEATRIEVSGTLAGSATAHETVHVLPGGRVEARVRAAKMLVDDGGVFRGELQSSTGDDSETAPRAASPLLAAEPTDRSGARRGGKRGPRNDRDTPRAKELPSTRNPRQASVPTTRGRPPAFAAPVRESATKPGVAEGPASRPPSVLPRRPAEPPRMPTLPRGRTAVTRRGGGS